MSGNSSPNQSRLKTSRHSGISPASESLIEKRHDSQGQQSNRRPEIGKAVGTDRKSFEVNLDPARAFFGLGDFAQSYSFRSRVLCTGPASSFLRLVTVL